jgi:hypothetical protein
VINKSHAITLERQKNAELKDEVTLQLLSLSSHQARAVCQVAKLMAQLDQVRNRGQDLDQADADLLKRLPKMQQEDVKQLIAKVRSPVDRPLSCVFMLAAVAQFSANLRSEKQLRQTAEAKLTEVGGSRSVSACTHLCCCLFDRSWRRSRAKFVL